MTTCHCPDSASTLAVARPRPEEAPVIITVDFVSVFLEVSDFLVSAGAATLWARTTTESGCLDALCATSHHQDWFIDKNSWWKTPRDLEYRVPESIRCLLESTPAIWQQSGQWHWLKPKNMYCKRIDAVLARILHSLEQHPEPSQPLTDHKQHCIARKGGWPIKASHYALKTNSMPDV